MKKILDCYNEETAYKSLSNILRVDECRIRNYMDHIFIKNGYNYRISINFDEEIDIKKFINDIAGVKYSKEEFKELIKFDEVSLYHVTTSINGCESIKKYGLLKRQQVLKLKEGDMKEFLNSLGIKLVVKSNTIDITYKNKKITIENKFDVNGNVWGFLHSNNFFSYGVATLYPEILDDIADVLDDDTILYEWTKIAKAYLVKANIPVYYISNFKYDYYIKQCFKYLFEKKLNSYSSEKYIVIKKKYNIEPFRIQFIKRKDDYLKEIKLNKNNEYI